MNSTLYCKRLCGREFTEFDLEQFKWMIDNDYMATWYLCLFMFRFIDNLPSAWATKKVESGNETIFYERGFPIGYRDDLQEKYYIYNHFNITILIHPSTLDPTVLRVVGFHVEPLRFTIDVTIQFEEKTNR